jgi:competence protein ComEA
VDVDRAEAAELDQLPGIGPALARRIVADREANGGFGSLAELQRVKGIGPALTAKLAPYVTFSAPLRPTHTSESRRQGAHP